MNERVEAEFVEDVEAQGAYVTWRERLEAADIAVRNFAKERPLVTFLGLVSVGYLVGRSLRKL
jgi:hypothetical protein